MSKDAFSPMPGLRWEGRQKHLRRSAQLGLALLRHHHHGPVSKGVICLNLIPLLKSSQLSETELELAEQPGEQRRSYWCLSASASPVLGLGAGQRILSPAVWGQPRSPALNHRCPARGSEPLPQAICVGRPFGASCLRDEEMVSARF